MFGFQIVVDLGVLHYVHNTFRFGNIIRNEYESFDHESSTHMYLCEDEMLDRVQVLYCTYAYYECMNR